MTNENIKVLEGSQGPRQTISCICLLTAHLDKWDERNGHSNWPLVISCAPFATSLVLPRGGGWSTSGHLLCSLCHIPCPPEGEGGWSTTGHLLCSLCYIPCPREGGRSNGVPLVRRALITIQVGPINCLIASCLTVKASVFRYLLWRLLWDNWRISRANKDQKQWRWEGFGNRCCHNMLTTIKLELL